MYISTSNKQKVANELIIIIRHLKEIYSFHISFIGVIGKIRGQGIIKNMQKTGMRKSVEQQNGRLKTVQNRARYLENAKQIHTWSHT